VEQRSDAQHVQPGARGELAARRSLHDGGEPLDELVAREGLDELGALRVALRLLPEL
jgi:hypothetical protein